MYNIFGERDGLCQCEECAYRCRNFINLDYPWCHDCEAGIHRKAKPRIVKAYLKALAETNP